MSGSRSPVASLAPRRSGPSWQTPSLPGLRTIFGDAELRAKVLPLRILEAVANRFCLVGLQERRMRGAALLVMPILAGPPVCAAGLGAAFALRPTFADYLGLVYIPLSALMLWSAYRTWAEFSTLVPDLEDLITEGDELVRIDESLRGSFRWTPQVLLVLLGAVARPLVGLCLSSGAMDNVANLPWLIAQAEAIGIGLGVVYWLWAALSWLRRLSHVKSIRGARDHESDPAFCGAYTLMAHVRRRVGIGAALALTPICVIDLQDPYGHVVLTSGLLTGTFTCLTLLAVTVLPFAYVSRLRCSAVDRQLRELGELLDAEIVEQPSRRLELEAAYARCRRDARSQSVSALDPHTAPGILATLFGPLLPLLLTLTIAHTAHAAPLRHNAQRHGTASQETQFVPPRVTPTTLLRDGGTVIRLTQ